MQVLHVECLLDPDGPPLHGFKTDNAKNSLESVIYSVDGGYNWLR